MDDQHPIETDSDNSNTVNAMLINCISQSSSLEDIQSSHLIDLPGTCSMTIYLVI